MDITPQEKYNRELLFVLRQLKDGIIRQTNKEFIVYTLPLYPHRNDPDAPNPTEEQGIIEKFKKLKLFEELERYDAQVNSRGKLNPDFFAIQIHLKINKPIFDRYYAKYEKTGEPKNKPFKISFSEDLYDFSGEKAVLNLAGVEVKISKDTNQDYLCRVLFLKFPQKNYKNILEPGEIRKAKNGYFEWSFKQILEISDHSIEPRNNKSEKDLWLPVYHAVNGLNDLIAREKGVKDFFLHRSIRRLQINPNYLTKPEILNHTKPHKIH